MRSYHLILPFCVCVSLAMAEDQPAVGGVKLAPDAIPYDAKVSLNEYPVEYPKSGGGTEKFWRQTIAFDSGITACAFNYTRLTDDALKGGAAANGGIGLYMPNSSAWYNGGFLDVAIGEKYRPMNAVPSKTSTRKEKGKATAELLFDGPGGGMKLEMMAVGAEAPIYCRLSCKPANRSDPVVVTLTTFPGGYSDASEGKSGVIRERWAVTSIQEATARGERTAEGKEVNSSASKNLETKEETKGTESLTLDPAKENWIFLADRALDPSRYAKGEGGAGLCYVPEDVSGVRVGMSPYRVTIILNTAASDKPLRFALWIFDKQPNDKALKAMQEHLAATAKRLRDW